MAKTVTDKTTDLYKLRHSCAHVLAQAVKRKYPTAKLGFGPPVEDGFYYDIHLPEALTDADLEAIEKEMVEIVKANYSFEKKDVTPDEARKIFSAKNETFKVETVDQLAGQEQLSIVVDGDFTDLCKYPHVHKTGDIKAFKLTSIAGAYWKGIETNPVMQRIYGTAFFSKKELDDFLRMREEAKKRDHRKLGKELALFMFSPFAAASPIFKPKGTVIYNLLRDYIRGLYRREGYQEVITPQIFDVELWKKSGHYEKYKDNMYFTRVDEHECAVKPMNCPSHTLIYSSELHSYRDLPVRIADFGRLHRFERSGVTSGLTRVRSFAQDDAHIFCTEDQVGSEISGVCRMIREVYGAFGFPEPKVFLSTRPERKVGSEATWDKAEAALEAAVKSNSLAYTINAGDGAFYGPKIDFVVKDTLGRDWQLGTIQLDFNMPERFELEYKNSDGGVSRPVMIHRAVLGSLERFIGILIEHYGGAFPFWLSPMQVSIIPIAQAHEAYGEKILKELLDNGFRAEIKAPAETLGSRIRRAQTEKIPYMIILGDKEIQAENISVRSRSKGDLGQTSLLEFIGKVNEAVKARTA
ncbi:MAG: threonine--tRNA ligase [Candidatus Omnitrophica bacterium CG07_land_8_20_14_0_80_50_8]|nr:MAG: threonine--tRNA ligase [Candidatus Omnitrophica bacterium CG07_land_8_20_14_0_80_50_8]